MLSLIGMEYLLNWERMLSVLLFCPLLLNEQNISYIPGLGSSPLEYISFTLVTTHTVVTYCKRCMLNIWTIPTRLVWHIFFARYFEFWEQYNLNIFKRVIFIWIKSTVSIWSLGIETTLWHIINFCLESLFRSSL